MGSQGLATRATIVMNGQKHHSYAAVPGDHAQESYQTLRPSKQVNRIRNGISQRQEGKRWLPRSLTLIALGLFALVLLCMLAALVAIREVSIKHHGIDLVTQNHYTWTYGPTAIFIILTALWRLIDYHCKALVPWAELQSGSVDADRSILLDHISPFLLLTFGAAVSKRHSIVVVTIAGFLLLKAVTIASTGLFLPSTIITGSIDADMQQTSQFDTTTNFSDFRDPGPAPFYTAYAIMQRGLAIPEGLTSDLLYETFTPAVPQNISNATYVVKSRAFVPQISCEAADVEPIINWDDFGSTVDQYEQLRVQNTSRWLCPPRTAWTADGLTILTCDAGGRICPPRRLYPSFGRIDCVPTAQIDQQYGKPYLIAVSDVRINQTFNQSTADYYVGDILTPSKWDFAIPKITAMLCTIGYKMSDVELTYNASSSSNPVQKVEQLPSGADLLENVSNDYLSRKLSFASPVTIGGARDMFGLVVDFDYVEEPPHTVLKMVADELGQDFAYLLAHPQEFQQSTEYVLANMLLQIAKEEMIIPRSNSTFQPKQVVGKESHTMQKLEVQPVPFAVMTVCLALVTLFTLAILLLRPRLAASDSPENIISTAKLVQRSHYVQKVFQQMTNSSEEAAANILRNAKYHTESGESGMLIHSTFDRETATRMVNPASGIMFNAPFALSKGFLVVTLASAPIAIAVLEYLQRKSDSGVIGIATINDPGSLGVVGYTRFLPAVIALLIATMFNSLDFQSMTLAPYHKMFSSPASRKDLTTPLLAQLPPMALVHAFRRGYWPACLTGVGAFIGSVLTIVISGLYTVDFIPEQTAISIASTQSWNLSFQQGLMSDNAAAAVSSVIESSAITYPAFTYDELVIPSMIIDEQLNTQFTNTSGFATALVPALRPDLVCQELDWRTVNYSIVSSSYKGISTGPKIATNATIPLPDNCRLGSSYGNESFVSWYISSAGLGGPANTSYFAEVDDIHVGPWYDHISFQATGTADRQQPANAPGCPSVGIAYGYFDGSDPSKSAFTALRCDQKIQQITTNVTFELPGMKISSDYPPIPDESTATYVKSGPNGEESYWWWLQSNLENPFSILNDSALDPYLIRYDNSSFPSVGSFFRGAFFGRTPLPLSTLQKNDTDSRALIFDHLQKFYRRYMVQYISSNMRVPLNSTNVSAAKRQEGTISNNNDKIEATFTPSIGTPRVVQHRTPKLVIQIMLAVMFICGSLALWLGNYHDLVLWNPCTIAGVMVLFAGSRICRPDDPAHLQTETHATQSSVEMTDLSLGHDRSRSMDGHGSNVALVSGSDVPLNGESRARLDNGRTRFRLGWWRDGVFIGNGKELNRGDHKLGECRYGIDSVTL